MSDNTIQLIKDYFRKNTINSNNIDSAFDIEMQNGMRAKRTIDANRTNQNYYRSRDVQTDLLNHYENVDWWERDTDFDLEWYLERL